MKRIGIIYNHQLKAAQELAQALHEKLSALSYDCWLSPSSQEQRSIDLAAGTDLILSVGGDGTILRSAQVAVPAAVPILGVNMGRLGFMTEMQGAEALEKVPRCLTSEGWIEERAMLEVEVLPQEGEATRSLALNDLVVGRGAIARVTQIQVSIDGAEVTTYRADGVIVATATGSTGYAMAAGGPIMYPQSKELLVLPIAPHLALASPLVVHSNAVVELRLPAGRQAVATVDGQADFPVRSGDVVRARRSSQVARFLRMEPPARFYATLTQRLHISPPG